MSEEKKVLLSRPKDRSLEAFRAWIAEIARNLGITKPSRRSDEEWAEVWKKFWSGAEAPEADPEDTDQE